MYKFKYLYKLINFVVDAKNEKKKICGYIENIEEKK